jgi:hypothetical protein
MLTVCDIMGQKTGRAHRLDKDAYVTSINPSTKVMSMLLAISGASTPPLPYQKDWYCCIMPAQQQALCGL